MSARVVYSLVLAGALAAAGCERLGIEDPAKMAAAREADGRAVGAGCRHAGRSLEDCYALNERALKAAVYSGWREMNDYMASNKIDAVPSQLLQAATSEAPVLPAGKPEPSKAEAAKPASPKTDKH